MSAIDKHLRNFSPEQRESLEHLRKTILSIAPDATECISYGMPAFKEHGKVIAGFEGFKNHCSYFPHSGSVLEQIGRFPVWCEVQKGTLRFPIGKQLPKSLVKKMIAVRRRQITVKSADIDDEWKAIGLAAPARRALVNEGLSKVAQLQKRTRQSIATLHGMGPNALKQLEIAMKASGVKFRSRV